MPKARRLETTKKRAPKNSVDESSSTPQLAQLIGCPVIDPIECQCPKTAIQPGEGVKMTCTWDSCPYDSQPLHALCYQVLEDNLVKRLGTLGSARGWTPPQRRNNLWEKKGQSLIGKFCRCRCGHGQMTRDKQALYEKEKAVEKEKKKKAKKAKQLPQLHFNSKPAAVMEEKKRVDSDVFPSPSVATATRTFSRTRLFTDRSAATTLDTIAIFETMSEASLYGETNGKYSNNSVFHSDEEKELDDDQDDAETLIVPAPLPPPQTKSYAATIKHEEDEPVEQEEEDKEQIELHELQEDEEIEEAPDVDDSALTQQVDSPDSGLERSTPPSTPEELEQGHGDNPLGLSLLSLSEIVETPKRTVVRSQSNVPKLPLAVSLEHTLAASGDSKKPEKPEDDSWTPMFGRGFNLGERILYFP